MLPSTPSPHSRWPFATAPTPSPCRCVSRATATPWCSDIPGSSVPATVMARSPGTPCAISSAWTRAAGGSRDSRASASRPCRKSSSEPCADIGREADLEERLVSTLEIYEALEGCGVWSADVRALDRIRALNPDVRLGLIWPSGRPQPLPALRTGEVIRAAAPALTKEGVETIQAAGFRCYAETADEPALVDRLVGWRVDALATGRPGVVRTRVDRLRSPG